MTTKVCPKCGSDTLVLYYSLNKKQCNNCKYMFEWNLDPGQKPICITNKLQESIKNDQN